MSPRSDAFVHVVATAGLIETLRAAGCDPGSVLAAAGLKSGDLEDPDKRISLRQYISLLDYAAQRSGDDCFGLHFGARFDPGSYGALGFVALNSPTIGAALLNVGRYLSVMRDQCRVILEVEGNTARLRYRLSAATVQARRHDAELALARICSGIRTVMGPSWAPSAVQFEHGAPKDDAPYTRFFAAPVRFGQSANVLAFGQEVLNATIQAADSRLLRILEGLMEEQLSRRRSDNDLVERVRRQVLEALHSGAPAIGEVAAAGGMSTRTLQRRLAEEGLTYNKLVDDLRYDLALEYLQEQSLSISEIAFLLGYSEASAFDRAFRRNSGLSPLEYRRQIRPSARPA